MDLSQHLYEPTSWPKCCVSDNFSGVVGKELHCYLLLLCFIFCLYFIYNTTYIVIIFLICMYVCMLLPEALRDSLGDITALEFYQCLV